MQEPFKFYTPVRVRFNETEVQIGSEAAEVETAEHYLFGAAAHRVDQLHGSHAEIVLRFSGDLDFFEP